MVVDYWDLDTRELKLDAGVYDEKSKAWLDKDEVPSNEEVYKTFNDILTEKRHDI